jgi:hypothetical protein
LQQLDKRSIITVQDIKAIRPTAELDQDRIDPFIKEAQDLDLRPILGDGLYYDFMTKYFVTGDAMYSAYQNLLKGVAYTYNGQTVYFDGLKPLLANFTLARFVQNNQVNVVRYGIVSKVNQQSQPVDGQVIRQVVNELRSNAMTYKNQVDTFLLNNQTTYTKYIGSNTSLNTGFRMFKG